MKRNRSIVPENNQWLHIYTLPNGQVYEVACAPYKPPSIYQRNLALKRAGVVLPKMPPACERASNVDIVEAMDKKVPDPRGVRYSYMHLGKRITLYWMREVCIEGPPLTARQKFEQKTHNHPGKYEFEE